eukprot:10779691-Lingulodinium_polyedra.AAC.1
MHIHRPTHAHPSPADAGIENVGEPVLGVQESKELVKFRLHFPTKQHRKQKRKSSLPPTVSPERRAANLTYSRPV